MPAFPEASTIDDKLSLMTESGISRVGAATGVVSVVVTFVGFGVHGALPTDTTAEAVEIYVKGVSASQAGIGNYLELLRSEEHTSELQSPYDLVCRLLLEKKKNKHERV